MEDNRALSSVDRIAAFGGRSCELYARQSGFFQDELEIIANVSSKGKTQIPWMILSGPATHSTPYSQWDNIHDKFRSLLQV